jgi:cytochrome c oxidase cbb3-type subunit 2
LIGVMILARLGYSVGPLRVLIAIVVTFGGLAEIVPLFNDAQTVKPSPGVTPYEPLRLDGRDVYVREGCYNCHSQMIRTLSFETQRYGDRSVAGEFVYDRPFQWGSKRTGPDLARVGGKYSDAWQRAHLLAPRDLVPRSNMPGYPWLGREYFDAGEVSAMMRALSRVGVPYSEADIAGADEAVRNKSKMEALIAYLQSLRAPQPSAKADAALPATEKSS